MTKPLASVFGSNIKFFNSLSHIRRSRWSSSMIKCSGSILTLVDHTVKIWNSFFEFISFRDVRNTRVL
jgi:hypothetical protein